MKVAVTYLHIVGRGYPEAPEPSHYVPFEERFSETYQKYDPGFPHHLRVVCCGGPVDDSIKALYPFADSFSTYMGAGSDLGTQQDAMKELDADFVVNLATPISFWKSGWLNRMVEARNKNGDGLYGPFASNEWLPHIRTSCWAVDRETFLRYPHLIDTREKCYLAEHKDKSPALWQFTFWYCSIARPTLMVTWDGEYGPLDWRTPANIMYRGDQSNCLMHDRYTLHWNTLSPEEKAAKDDRITRVCSR